MNDLQFDLKVDKSAKTVFIERAFDAELALVWEAFTTPALLDQWWAPKPFQSRTKVMDFKVGGRRFYAMVSPDGQERWSLQQYKSITPKTNFQFFNVFADADETPQLPGSHWDFTFHDLGEMTKVSIVIKNDSLERMEKMIEMGFVEGFTATLNTLKELLIAIK